ncbi:Helicase-associated domain [Penicillium camemberti]|uniref:Helicase-associated domain n=1 Tax=Penicillium camemberti (strain FM 013) TaxID=1429867 RepID=A0A0G4PC39_PENC3|nr:Helicase-associated domain [Penicillium camemberti]
MATGTSACIHLRNIKKGCFFVRNEASNPHGGLVQSRFPQSSRNIHTIWSTTTPLRSTRKLYRLGPIITGNRSALKGQPTTGAHYSTYPPPLLESAVNKIVSNRSPTDDLPIQPQQYTPAQVTTVHLPIQDNVLSTMKDARKVLEYANRDMLWADGSRRKNKLQPLRRHDPNYVARGTARFKHRLDACDSPDVQAPERETPEMPVGLSTKQILDVINSNTYSIIGEKLDIGKTTQVPRIILEDAMNNSTAVPCRVLCVQKNEFEAVEMAHGVARERFGELGVTIFHGVPPDHIARLPRGTIRYCSRHDWLKILKDGPSILGQFSHIILDETWLHDLDIKVGMMLLKRFVEQRKSIRALVPKVILMSSFTHANGLCSYFGTKTTDGTLLPAPHVTIPRDFPVKKYYLEQVMGKIAHSLTPEIIKHLLHEDKKTQAFLSDHFKLFEKTVKLNRHGKEIMPSGLVSATLLSLLSTTKTGSILVFVPRDAQARRVMEQITAFGPKLGFDFTDKDRFRITRLHSNTTEEEKAEIQLGIPPGCRRLIISTQRSGFTIPDVRYIVDSGKSMNYSLRKGRSVNWISQTVASQREECTDKVQAGEYYFLGAKNCFDSLSVTTPTETPASRSNLQRACLHVRRSTSGTSLSIAELFAQTFKPPRESRVCAAVNDLKELQLLDEQEELTTLGHLLVDLNMDPCLGKMVALGIIFQCLDPMLILASLGWNPDLFSKMLSSPDPDPSPGVGESFMRSVNESGYHVAITNTFGAIRKMSHKEFKLPASWKKVPKDCLSEVYHKATPKIDRMINKLKAAQIIPARKSFGYRAYFSCSYLNTHSKNEALIKALLLQCLSSNLAVKPFGYTTIKFKSGEIAERDPDYSISKNYIMAYNFESFRASKPHGLIQKTQVNPLAACLLGSKIEQEEDSVILDSWVKIKPQSVKSSGNELAKDLVQTHKVFNEALHTAFKILPYQGMASFDSSAEWFSYLNARKHFFNAIRKTLQDILHAHDPLAQSTGKGI